MKKEFKSTQQQAPIPKAIMQLIDSFSDAYKNVLREEDAEEIFTVRRLRDYFQAWPIPKMPDPLPPYLDELDRRGYKIVTTYDGSPAILCANIHVQRYYLRDSNSCIDADSSPIIDDDDF